MRPYPGLLAPPGRTGKVLPSPHDLGSLAGAGGCPALSGSTAGEVSCSLGCGCGCGPGWLELGILRPRQPMFRDHGLCHEAVPVFQGAEETGCRTDDPGSQSSSRLSFCALLVMEAVPSSWVPVARENGLLPRVEPASCPSMYGGTALLWGRRCLTSRAGEEGAGTGHHVRVAGGAGTYPSQDKRLH